MREFIWGNLSPSHDPPYQIPSIEAVKAWRLDGLTLALTPALCRTSASHGERENPFPRPANMGELDWRWFRGSMRETTCENSYEKETSKIIAGDAEVV